MGGGPARGEPSEPIDVKYLAPHEVEDMGPHHMDAPAVPLLQGVGVQQGAVLVLPVHEQGGERLGLQPVQLAPICLLPGHTPPWPPQIIMQSSRRIPFG